jgi:hypothetical protein
VVYEDIYEGIDVHLCSNRSGPLMFIVVRPGGDPYDIMIQPMGHDQMQIDLEGYLRLYIGERFMRMSEGYAYQEGPNGLEFIEEWTAHYEEGAWGETLSFEIDNYNHNEPLILMVRPYGEMPMIGGGGAGQPPEWSTYMAGPGEDALMDLTHDGDGFVYFTGHSSSGNSSLPITLGGNVQSNPGGMDDVIIGRFNEYYEIETEDTWMTYLGGNQTDRGFAITYDDVNDRLVVAGWLGSDAGSAPNFAWGQNANSYSRPAGVYSGFVAFLDKEQGERIYLSRTPGQPITTSSIDVAVDGQGHTFITGQGFLYDTDELEGNAIPSGAYGQIYTTQTGDVMSDCYVLELDPEANLTWFTVLGGPDDEFMGACAVDRNLNRLYVVGSTQSKNVNLNNLCTHYQGWQQFPLCQDLGYFQRYLNGIYNDLPPPAWTDGFMTTFDLDTRQMIWSSYLGGGGEDRITDVVVAPNSSIYVAGYSNTHSYNTSTCIPSNNEGGFPACNAFGYFNSNPNQRKHFITRFDWEHKMTWSTKLGDNSLLSQGSPDVKLAMTDNGVLLYASTHHGSTHTTPLTMTIYSNAYHQSGHRDDFGGSSDSYLGLFNFNTQLLYGTYLGGIGNDFGHGVTGVGDRIYVCGSTHALLAFPTHAPEIAGHSPYLNEVPQPQADGFIAQLVYDLTIGVDEIDLPVTQNGITLYPNPANELVYFGVEELQIDRAWVSDGMGRIVRSLATTGQDRNVIDIRQLPSGVYILSVEATGGERRTARFLKQ